MARSSPSTEQIVFIVHDVSTRNLEPASVIHPSFLNIPIYTFWALSLFTLVNTSTLNWNCHASLCARLITCLQVFLSTLAWWGVCTCSANVSHPGVWYKACFFHVSVPVSALHWWGQRTYCRPKQIEAALSAVYIHLCMLLCAGVAGYASSEIVDLREGPNFETPWTIKNGLLEEELQCWRQFNGSIPSLTNFSPCNPMHLFFVLGIISQVRSSFPT